MLRLVVGLGNPGRRYRGTRHNVGFEWVDRVASHLGAKWKSHPRFRAELAEWTVAEHGLWAMKPQTLMNRSGQAVGPFARSKGLAPESLLVVHDDLDLDPGAIRLKVGGGHGGHNGLRDLVDELDSREFLRLRIGIGHPGDRSQVTPYVLSRPSPEERAVLETAMDRGLSVLPDLVVGDWQKAVEHLHSAQVPKR